MSEALEAANENYCLVNGEPLQNLPHDLYIPPDALRVILETFSGPLDILLYLIRKHNLDILDIPIAEITRQYMDYVEWIKSMHLELAAEYLVMAAMLAEIKSRMLLPRPQAEEEEEPLDPRAELVARLKAYEQFKNAATAIDEMAWVGRDHYMVAVAAPEQPVTTELPPLPMSALLDALKEVMQRAQLQGHHQITKEKLSVRERMTQVLSKIPTEGFIEFVELFNVDEGREGIVVSFLAILELAKESLIEIVQRDVFAPVYVRAPQQTHEGDQDE